MSIRAIKLDEVKEIMSRVLGSEILKKYELDQQNEIRLALNAVLLANRNAVLFTYGKIPDEMFGDGLLVREINLLEVTGKPCHPAKLYRELENLLCNCLSEGGTDFMAADYREVIVKIMHHLNRRCRW
jgi:hypothetical protein